MRIGACVLLMIVAACEGGRPYDVGHALLRDREIPLVVAFAARCALSNDSPAVASFDALLEKSLAISCPAGTRWSVAALLKRCSADPRYLRWVLCDGEVRDFLPEDLLTGPRDGQ